MDLAELFAPFPHEAVSWRIQGQPIERNGQWKGMALAYIDARDVMDRLDEVCGPANWQTEFSETPKGRVIGRIGIRIDGEWVWKSDGAGDTAVEGEKGGISDSLKRAAVNWGIGRYLYALDAPWCPCEVKQSNGKTYFKKWIGSPWDHVRNAPADPAPILRDKPDPSAAIIKATARLVEASSIEQLATIWKNLPPEIKGEKFVMEAKDARKAALSEKAVA